MDKVRNVERLRKIQRKEKWKNLVDITMEVPPFNSTRNALELANIA